MRRLALIVALAGMCQFVVPAPAYAWYGWFDQLSGAGPWKGYHVDLRIVCFDDPKAEEERAAAIERATGSPPFPTPEELANRARRAAMGLEASCPTDSQGYKRRSSVGVEFRLFHAEADPRYAANREIRLITLEPSFSRSVFRDPRWNFVDIGAAGGFYWFSSEGFRSINGIVLEPLRVDLHFPPRFPIFTDRLQTLAPMVVLRLGILTFARGFEPNEFAANTRETARRLPSEFLFARTIFLDLSPLFHLER